MILVKILHVMNNNKIILLNKFIKRYIKIYIIKQNLLPKIHNKMNKNIIFKIKMKIRII